MAMILAFAGSNSSVSINLKLVQFTASLIKNHKLQVMNLANYPFVVYSQDEEKNNGFSNSLIQLSKVIHSSDALILAVNEHNSNPSAYFKNLIDWLSRVDKNFLLGTKIFLMATSPGKRGASSALEIIEKLVPRFGGEVVAVFSLPSFDDNFDVSKGITNKNLSQQHKEALDLFLSKV